MLGAIQVEFAVPDGVRAELLRVEGKPDATQRDNNASSRLGHWGVAEKLPLWIVGRLGLLRLAKRLGGQGEAERTHKIDESRKHRGRSLRGRLMENSLRFNSIGTLVEVLTGERRRGG